MYIGKELCILNDTLIKLRQKSVECFFFFMTSVSTKNDHIIKSTENTIIPIVPPKG